MIPRHGDLFDNLDDGRAARPGRGLGGYPAPAPSQAAASQRWSALDRRSSGARRHHLCAAGRRALAAAVRPRAWLRQPSHLLAAATGLAARRRMGEVAPPTAGLARRRRAGRLVEGRHRLGQCPSPAWRELTGANPVDRGKPGSKYHPLIDGTGIPLAVGLSAANTHDSQLLEQLVDAVPAIVGPRGRPGRPRRRPAKLHADKGYDYPSCRRALRRRGITPRIARRGIESSQRLGRHRSTVERSLAWLLANRRVTVRYERRADLLMAFLHLACALTCSRKLKSL